MVIFWKCHTLPFSVATWWYEKNGFSDFLFRGYVWWSRCADWSHAWRVDWQPGFLNYDSCADTFLMHNALRSFLHRYSSAPPRSCGLIWHPPYFMKVNMRVGESRDILSDSHFISIIVPFLLFSLSCGQISLFVQSKECFSSVTFPSCLMCLHGSV